MILFIGNRVYFHILHLEKYYFTATNQAIQAIYHEYESPFQHREYFRLHCTGQSSSLTKDYRSSQSREISPTSNHLRTLKCISQITGHFTCQSTPHNTKAHNYAQVLESQIMDREHDFREATVSSRYFSFLISYPHTGHFSNVTIAVPISMQFARHCHHKPRPALGRAFKCFIASE